MYGTDGPGRPPVLKFSGKVDWIADPRAAVGSVLARLETNSLFSSVIAVGHRVVHGMHHIAPELVTPELIADLDRISGAGRPAPV